MAIYRNCVCVCVCVELNKRLSGLKCRRALRRHPHVIIAGAVLGAESQRLQSQTQNTNIAGAAPARKLMLQRRSKLRL